MKAYWYNTMLKYCEEAGIASVPTKFKGFGVNDKVNGKRKRSDEIEPANKKARTESSIQVVGPAAMVVQTDSQSQYFLEFASNFQFPTVTSSLPQYQQVNFSQGVSNASNSQPLTFTDSLPQQPLEYASNFQALTQRQENLGQEISCETFSSSPDSDLFTVLYDEDILSST